MANPHHSRITGVWMLNLAKGAAFKYETVVVPASGIFIVPYQLACITDTRYESIPCIWVLYSCEVVSLKNKAIRLFVGSVVVVSHYFAIVTNALDGDKKGRINDKNLLFCGASIGKNELCVKRKTGATYCC